MRAMLRNFEFFDAPHIAILCMHKSFGLRVALDVGAYLQTLLLAMWSRGIASCAQASLSSYPGIVRRELSIPDELRILCGISFGYEIQPCRPTARGRGANRWRRTWNSSATSNIGKSRADAAKGRLRLAELVDSARVVAEKLAHHLGLERQFSRLCGATFRTTASGKFVPNSTLSEPYVFMKCTSCGG